MSEIPGSPTDEVDDLLTVLPHEISTPLTVIGGYAEMLRERCATDERAMAAVTAIERNAELLNAMLADLAEARDGAIAITPVPVDLVDVLEGVRDDATGMLGGRDVTWALPARPCEAEIDPDAFGRAVRNLLDNAMKFAGPPAPLRIGVTVEGGDVVVRVSDGGPGIDERWRDQLFGRFARLDSTRRGLGLGLHLTRSIARAHGGDATHEPTPGGGATFVVRVPRRPARGGR